MTYYQLIPPVIPSKNSTAFSLLVVPVAYYALHRKKLGAGQSA